MTLDVALLVALVLSALWTVTSVRIMRAVIGLALTSAILTVIIFRLDSPLAAVFELSVCAGLIPAIFISAIGLTRRLAPEALAERRRAKLRQYALLPVILLLVAGAMLLFAPSASFFPKTIAASAMDVRDVLWNLRHVDLIGQMLVLSAAAFGVVVLVKGARRE